MRTDTKLFNVTHAATDVSEADISQRAYELWEAEGRPEGKEQQHWLQAEEELKKQHASNRRTEASGPPSSATETAETDDAGAEPLALREEKAHRAGSSSPSEPPQAKGPAPRTNKRTRRSA